MVEIGNIRSKILQYDSDPTSPSAEKAWVRRTVTSDGVVGEPRGLLLALTYTGQAATSTYELSYRTKESTTIRTVLS